MRINAFDMDGIPLDAALSLPLPIRLAGGINPFVGGTWRLGLGPQRADDGSYPCELRQDRAEIGAVVVSDPEDGDALDLVLTFRFTPERLTAIAAIGPGAPFPHDLDFIVNGEPLRVSRGTSSFYWRASA